MYGIPHPPPHVLARDLLAILCRSPINKLYLEAVDMAMVLPPVEKGNIPWRLAMFTSTPVKLDLSQLIRLWELGDTTPVNRTMLLPGEETFFQLQQMLTIFETFPDRHTDKPAGSRTRTFSRPPLPVRQPSHASNSKATRPRTTVDATTASHVDTTESMDTDTTFSEDNPMNSSVGTSASNSSSIITSNSLELGLLSAESTELLRKLMKDISIEHYSVHAATIEEQSRRTLLLESSISQLRTDQSTYQAQQKSAAQASSLHRLKQEIDMTRLSLQALNQTRRSLREDIRLHATLPEDDPAKPDENVKSELLQDIQRTKTLIATERKRIDEVLLRVRSER